MSEPVKREPLFIGLPMRWDMQYRHVSGPVGLSFEIDFASPKEADKFRDFVMANVFYPGRPPRVVEY